MRLNVLIVILYRRFLWRLFEVHYQRLIKSNKKNRLTADQYLFIYLFIYTIMIPGLGHGKQQS